MWLGLRLPKCRERLRGALGRTSSLPDTDVPGDSIPNRSAWSQVRTIQIAWWLVLGGLSGAWLAGCTANPEARPASGSPSVPLPGDTPANLVERGLEFYFVYAFELDGQRYGFANAYSNNIGYDLIFFDGQLGCASEAALTELTDWEWVDEVDGLAYLASRLRQACGLEAQTPARELPQKAASLEESDAVPASRKKAAGERVGDFFDDHEFAGLLVGSVVYSAFLIWGPAFIVAGAIDEAVRSHHHASGGRPVPISTADLGANLGADLTRPDIEAVLGKPDIEFQLPKTGAVVLAYDLKSSQPYFVGLSGDQVAWLHAHNYWLSDLAKRASRNAKRAEK